MASKNWVLARLKRITGPAADSFGNEDEYPAGQPYSGLVYADDGNYYETIQEAVDAADGYARAGAGTFNENVTISTPNFTLAGVGRDTSIDGTDQGVALTVDAPNATVEDLTCQTDNGSGFNAILITDDASGAEIKDVEKVRSGATGILGQSGASEVVVRSCRVAESDDRAVDLLGDECRVEGTYALSGADDGLRVAGENSAITQCYAIETGNEGIELAGDGCRATDNTVDSTADNGMSVSGDNCVVNSNVIKNSGDDGIRLSGANQVVVGNRVGGSAGTNIDTGAATSPTTGNNETAAL